MDKELSAIKKRLHQLNCSKDKLAAQIDNLDVTDKHYDKMYADMQTRLYSFYDEIELVENEIEDKEKTVLTIKEQFLKQFLESVEIFKEQQPSGQILKSITFKFPVFYDGENITEICWDGITELETVCLLTK